MRRFFTNAMKKSCCLIMTHSLRLQQRNSTQALKQDANESLRGEFLPPRVAEAIDFGVFSVVGQGF
jgi:hypothetical protein